MKTPIAGDHPAVTAIVEALGLGDLMVTRLILKASAESAVMVVATFFVDGEAAEAVASVVKSYRLTAEEIVEGEAP